MQVQLSVRHIYLFVMLSFVSGIIWLSAAPVSQAQNDICESVTQISAAECQALVALYDSTHSTGWNQRASWLLTETPCEWYGVTCRDGHVVTLALSNNNLSGTLPSAIGDLTHLQVLDLAENQLSGKLPPELGSLRQLKWLYLNDNAFSGPLPTSLMNLDNLEKLWFYHTNLCEAANAPLTTWLGSLTDVQYSNVTCVNNVTTASVNLASTEATITSTLPITAMPNDLDSTPVMTEVVGSMAKMTDTMKLDASAIMTEVMNSLATMTSTENIDPAAVAAEVMKSMAKMPATTNLDADVMATEVMSALNKMTATMNMDGSDVATETITMTTETTSTVDMETITTTTTATDTITSTVVTTTTADELTIASSTPLTAASAIPQSGGVLPSTNGAGIFLAALAMLGLLMGGMVINRKFYPEQFE